MPWWVMEWHQRGFTYSVSYKAGLEINHLHCSTVPDTQKFSICIYWMNEMWEIGVCWKSLAFCYPQLTWFQLNKHHQNIEYGLLVYKLNSLSRKLLVLVHAHMHAHMHMWYTEYTTAIWDDGRKCQAYVGAVLGLGQEGGISLLKH